MLFLELNPEDLSSVQIGTFVGLLVGFGTLFIMAIKLYTYFSNKEVVDAVRHSENTSSIKQILDNQTGMHQLILDHETRLRIVEKKTNWVVGGVSDGGTHRP